MKPVLMIAAVAVLPCSLSHAREVPPDMERQPYMDYEQDKLDDADVCYDGGFRVSGGARYSGRNIWITNENDAYFFESFTAQNAHSVHIEDLTIIDCRSTTVAVIYNMSDKSVLTNLHIILNSKGTSRELTGLMIANAEVELNGYKLTNTDPDNVNVRYGMQIYQQSVVTGRGYEFEMGSNTRAFDILGSDSTVDLRECRITDREGAYGQRLAVFSGTRNVLKLTDSFIDLEAASAIRATNGINRFIMKGGSLNVRGDENMLINSMNAGVVLDALFEEVVELKGRIYSSGGSTLNVSLVGSRWDVEQGSRVTSVSLDSASALGFESYNGDPALEAITDLSALSVALAAGSRLILDHEAEDFSAGDVLMLFRGVTNWENDGALLVTSDHRILEYIDLQNGSFELTGNILLPIPEPAGASLALCGLAALLLRRR